MTKEVLALPMECWRWIPGFEGLYQVSTRGRVRSVDRWITYPDGSKRFFKGRILKPTLDKYGYLLVTLSRDGKKRPFKIHRLVAMAFIPNPENKPQVNHLDENPCNNVVENLSWASAKENLTWGTGIERRAASLSKPVQAINPSTGEVVLEFPSIIEAERKGFNQGNIYSCCRGKRKTHKGYMWRYKE